MEWYFTQFTCCNADELYLKTRQSTLRTMVYILNFICVIKQDSNPVYNYFFLWIVLGFKSTWCMNVLLKDFDVKTFISAVEVCASHMCMSMCAEWEFLLICTTLPYVYLHVYVYVCNNYKYYIHTKIHTHYSTLHCTLKYRVHNYLNCIYSEEMATVPRVVWPGAMWHSLTLYEPCSFRPPEELSWRKAGVS